MRTSIKKALSLIVVLVMLLTMIPAGMISISAEEAPTIDLSNYDTAEEYVINNLADWELIAESDKDFAGIVVKLGTDIDAGGYTELLRPENLTAEGAPPRRNGQKPTSGFEEASTFAATFPTLFKNFAGTFDGDGHTIKNARVEEGLIAAVTGDGAEIKNVYIDNVISSDFIDYADFGIVVGTATGSIKFDNVHVTNGSIPCNTFNSMHFQSAGGLLGFADAAEGIEDACLTIVNCTVDADVAASGEWNQFGEPPKGAGILIGTVWPSFDVEIDNVVASGNMKQYANYIGTIGLLHVGENRYCDIKNVTVQNATFHTSHSVMTHGSESNGGLIGVLSPRSNAYINIEKVNVIDTRISSTHASLGGLIGMVQSMNTNPAIANYTMDNTPVIGAEINISNIYTNAILCQLEVSHGGSAPQYCFVGGLIGQLGEGDSSGDQLGRFYRGDVNIYNCYIEATVMAGYETVTEKIYDQGAGGLLGVYAMPAGEAYISDIILDVTFPFNKLGPTEGMEYVENTASAGDAYNHNVAVSDDSIRSVGLIAFAGHTRFKSAVPGYGASDNVDAKYKPGADKFFECYLYVEDVITTVQENVGAVAHNNRKGGIHYNDVDLMCGDFSSNKVTNLNKVFYDEGIVKVLPVEAKQMVKFDENGYVDAILGAAAAPVEAVQTSAAADGKVNVRFVGFAAFDNADAVVAGVMIGDKMFTFENVALLDEVNAANGVDAYTTKDFGAKKMMAVTVKNVPVVENTSVAWVFVYKIGDRIVTTNETIGVMQADGTIVAIDE